MENPSYQSQSQDCIKLRAPGKYHVIMLNDDTTPMDFVVDVLIEIFNKAPDEARKTMLEIHEKGRSIAGTYSYEIAEQKSSETESYARSNTFPLSVHLQAV